MKTRYKILSIILIIVVLFLIFLNLPTIHKQPRCDEGYVSIAGDCILNYDLPSILRGMIQERMDYQYFTTIYKSSDKQLEIILEYCIDSKDLIDTVGLSYYNDTHSIDTVNCKWGIIEQGFINDPIYENNRNELQQVLDYCDNKSGTYYESLYFYSNNTHNIDNITCEWKEHVTFPNTDNLCIPYIDKWVSGEAIGNKTHIFDKDSCTWKDNPDYAASNDKGCPQFCPKDATTEKIGDMQEIIIDENKRGNDYGIQSSMPISIIEYPTSRNLDDVLQNCERWEKARAVNFTSPDGTKFYMTTEGYAWHNSTHYIDNNICDFIPMKKHIEDSIISAILEYCGSSHKLSYDNPYEYWFANETHYIDADTCLWQSLDDDITLVLPDHWKIVYSDD